MAHDTNPEFDDADAAVIVGANDALNPLFYYTRHGLEDVNEAVKNG